MNPYLRRLFFVIILLFATSPVGASILYVRNTATGANSGANWTNAYTDLQDALDAAVSGDEIWVAAGTYYPSSDYGLGGGSRYYHFRMKSSVSIFGGFTGNESSFDERYIDSNKTFLSGDIGTVGDTTDNCYHVFYHPDGSGSALLDGVIITGGNANGWGANDNGGGIYNCSFNITVANCIFIQNCATNGGGIFNEECSPEIANCTFLQNSATNNGGSMFNKNATPRITNCTFGFNSADYSGGGIFNSLSTPRIIKCIFNQNSADSGGGMYNSGTYEYAGYSPVVTGCVFRQNNGNNGGGIYNSGFAIYVGQYPLRITNCIFSQNTATNGGGLYNWNDAAPEIINCSFNQNHANQGGGIYNEDSSSPVLTNCILWGDTADNQAEVYNSDSSPVFSFCNIQGSGGSNSWDSAMGTDNGNNIDTAPLFFDPENGDLHLKYGSPCIDEGDNNAVSGNLWLLKDAITEDMDGDARVVDGNHDDEAVVDMGADEFNSLPIANAGDDATVAGGERVVLDGSASTDSNGTITEWLWEQTEGTKVVLSSPTSAKASFIAPLVPSNESLTFRLTVTDKEGLKDTDICNITVTASSVGGTTSGGGGCFIKAIGD